MLRCCSNSDVQAAVLFCCWHLFSATMLPRVWVTSTRCCLSLLVQIYIQHTRRRAAHTTAMYKCTCTLTLKILLLQYMQMAAHVHVQGQSPSLDGEIHVYPPTLGALHYIPSHGWSTCGLLWSAVNYIHNICSLTSAPLSTPFLPKHGITTCTCGAGLWQLCSSP